MTREEIIKGLFRGMNCTIPCPEALGCKECIEIQFAEYEKQIKDKALDEMSKANHIAINRLYVDIFKNNGDRPSRNEIHKTLSRVLRQLKGE